MLVEFPLDGLDLSEYVLQPDPDTPVYSLYAVAVRD